MGEKRQLVSPRERGKRDKRARSPRVKRENTCRNSKSERKWDDIAVPEKGSKETARVPKKGGRGIRELVVPMKKERKETALEKS